MYHPAGGNPQCSSGAEAPRRTTISSSNIDSATTASIARPPSSLYSSTIPYGPRAAESLRSSSNEDRLVRIIQLLNEAIAIIDDHEEAALDIMLTEDDGDFQQEGTCKMKRDDPHKQ
jgi:hypothetical protein